jgi:TRAP-type mannitol/chloroaromatic compound transport system substrate-binding protein
MMGSYHQAMEFFEIVFNKKKYESLPKDLQALLKYAAEAASTSNFALAMDNYSKDLIELRDKDKVNIIRTPQGIFDAEIKAWDKIVKKLVDEDPFFAKVWASQKAWGKRVGYYHFFNNADYKAAYEHIFGKLGF